MSKLIKANKTYIADKMIEKDLYGRENSNDIMEAMAESIEDSAKGGIMLGVVGTLYAGLAIYAYKDDIKHVAKLMGRKMKNLKQKMFKDGE